MSIYATLAVAALEAMLSSGKLPRIVELCIELARAGNMACLRWARLQGVPFDGNRCLEVAPTNDMRNLILELMRASVRADPIHLVPLAAIGMIRLCANPIPYLVQPNKPSDFGEIEDLPF